ncbi:MAG: cephalosporin hydroxylase family protein [Hyphomicrobium sp.]|uniref:cephalosporin hydroxylase family protein n=1 Tax=Hyphomicrobium sp. TaxID=82 RepID=UPI0013284956|nr:CmcI family methyltransferase [Hyphomicrobium sp.]KAB2938995.1 MAG: hydroxylase [Hyphomicrobium sp.]MBZ0211779.1 cephalosporin hydroxylase family protein [Hyphomicrobium sp.]
MKLTIDTKGGTLSVEDGSCPRQLDLYSRESFEQIARLWTDIGWVRKYSYGFAWMGRPIIQLPDDMMRIQETVFTTKPDVIVETGVAHGGSLLYYASLFELMGNGRVIGIDIEIRPHNRTAIEAHPLFKRVTLVEGNAVAAETVAMVKSMIKPDEKVMLILDSNHSKDHVAKELAAYADLVTPGCYLLVQDGIMHYVAGMPRTGDDWSWNNPISATEEFLAKHTEFEPVRVPRPFDETQDTPDCTHHPKGWLRRK